MKIPINWLQQYVNVSVENNELFERLTMAGLEVEDVKDVAGDAVFEIEVTPNRPDLLCMLGIAREVSAVLDEELTCPQPKSYESLGEVNIDIQAPDVCSRYIGTLIKDITISPTPGKIDSRLKALGMNGVNSIVDITNFSLFENGQPLHAFDYDKLAGGQIVVRFAKKGEKLLALDDIEYELDENILVIADAKKPVAIAGIMGGKETGVTESTKNILLESAYFDMTLIRRTSRKIGLSSDSCYRFERGVSFEGVAFGADRATDLILNYCGGEVTSKNDVIAQNCGRCPQPIEVTSEKIKNLIGTAIDITRGQQILTRLGFSVAVTTNALIATAPLNRGDISIAEDVIEEIARVMGFDNLPSSLPLIKAINIPADHSQGDIAKILNEQMRQAGYSEVIPFSLTNSAALDKCNQSNTPRINIKNPLSLEQEAMRPSMLPSLMGIYQTNYNRGQKDVALFEIGKIYPTNTDEQRKLGILLGGKHQADWRKGAKVANVDFYDVKGVIEQILETLKIENVVFEAANCQALTEGQSAKISVGTQVIGHVGAVAKDVLSNWGIKKSKAYFAILDIDMLDNLRCSEKKLIPLCEYPTTMRSISCAVSQDVEYGQVLDICRKCGGDLLTDVSFTELYLGEKIDQGQRGLVFSMTFQSNERTLTDDEVNAIQEVVSQKLAQDLGAVFR